MAGSMTHERPAPMTHSPKTLLLSLLMLPMATAIADKGDHKGKHKETYWDGQCMVERKYKKGEFEEKRKCKDEGVVVYQPGPVYQAVPVYQPGPVYLPPPPVAVDPGVVIQGTVRIR
jgi:hypothetical protein